MTGITISVFIFTTYLIESIWNTNIDSMGNGP